MTLFTKVHPEDFDGAKQIYDEVMADNVSLHDFVYPHVFGADQYIGQFSDNSREELELMAKCMALPKDSRVLDVGCGRGNIAYHMAKVFQWQLTGIDLSEVPIQSATEKYKEISPNIEFINCSIYDLISTNDFDGIYGTGAFCHFDAQRLFAHCHGLLKVGGKLAFMERVRVGDIADEDWHKLTTQWCCPSVYSTDEYAEILHQQGFSIRHQLDLTDTFKLWQDRSVTVRQELKNEIISRSSSQYYEKSLAFAQYENNVTRSGALGYVCFVAEKD